MSKSFETLGLNIPEILLPSEGTDYAKWAVIACDQFTSDRAYWKDVEDTVGTTPSTLRLILPEVYLGKDDEEERISSIHSKMEKYIEDGTLRKFPRGIILTKRISEGRSRLGFVVSVDLEKYDYSADSSSLIRATEGTVIERIPPRLKVRDGASIEIPHIILLIDDPNNTVINPLVTLISEEIYDFELMKDGGRIYGSFIEAKYLEEMQDALSYLYDNAIEKYGDKNAILYAVGDGNHSLATAKAYWEKLKKTLTKEEQKDHPARFALCEIENIHDDGIQFEAIHRVVFAKDDNNTDMIMKELLKLLNEENEKAYSVKSKNEAPGNSFVIPYIIEGVENYIVIESPSHKLEVGVLQNALDVIVKELKLADIDYIHGEASTRSLASEKGNIGFLLPAMDKFDLFPAIAGFGSLPRKTFSMGEANEKRYYIEAKSIAR